MCEANLGARCLEWVFIQYITASVTRTHEGENVKRNPAMGRAVHPNTHNHELVTPHKKIRHPLRILTKPDHVPNTQQRKTIIDTVLEEERIIIRDKSGRLKRQFSPGLSWNISGSSLDNMGVEIESKVPIAKKMARPSLTTYFTSTIAQEIVFCHSHEHTTQARRTTSIIHRNRSAIFGGRDISHLILVLAVGFSCSVVSCRR